MLPWGWWFWIWNKLMCLVWDVNTAGSEEKLGGRKLKQVQYQELENSPDVWNIVRWNPTVGNTWCHLVPCARLSSRRGEVSPGWLSACAVDGISLEFGGSSCSANLSLSPVRCGQATGTQKNVDREWMFGSSPPWLPIIFTVRCVVCAHCTCQNQLCLNKDL